MYKTYNSRPIPGRATQNQSRRPRRQLGVGFLLIVIAYVCFVLLRPLPPANVTITPPVLPALVKVNIPWPNGSATEQAAYGADGYGLLTAKGSETPVPTASVAKTITAMAVLTKKPLQTGEQGPVITLTADDVAIYNKYVAQDGSVIPVTTGQTITEYEAIQALMLPSANNVAETVAIWAFGSIAEYNAYANNYVRSLGMSYTTVTDPSGFLPTTVSTASDLVRLGDAALDNPVLSEIINQKSAETADFGKLNNVNILIGQSGIRGIKTGNTDQAGGCYLSAADVTIGGKTITVITAIALAPSLTQAMRDSLPLIQSSASQFQTIRVVTPGQNVGQASTAWGAHADIVAQTGITVTAWSGSSVAPKSTKKSIRSSSLVGTTAGSLALDFNGKQQTTDLQLKTSLAGPSLWWRLSHPL